jgi:DNA-binding transcriptional regulator GbsR (MarR family)
MQLTSVQQKFILHWGEMGTRWGINRTVAQIHALLYIAARPLTADDIAAILSVARSNVSTSLRELQAWGIVRVVHVLGDRRDHFESMTDVWAMFQKVLDERKRREIDPTLIILQECIEEARRDPEADPQTRQRLSDLLDFFQTMSTWYGQIRCLPPAAVIKFVKMGSKVKKLLGLAS